MTCFWDAILSSMSSDDFTLLGLNDHCRDNFIGKLKELNKQPNTIWNNTELRIQEKLEHVEAVNCYIVSGINNGHLTSICDSFLLLLSDLLSVDINHWYRSHMITYKCKSPRKTLTFKSNTHHFSIG